MYKNKTFLAIILARGGNKGLPGKNIKELCGKPLKETFKIYKMAVNNGYEKYLKGDAIKPVFRKYN